VLFNVEVIPYLDITGLDALAQLDHKLTKKGLQLLLARVKDPVLEGFNRSGLSQQMGPSHIFRHMDDAVAAYTATASTA